MRDHRSPTSVSRLAAFLAWLACAVAFIAGLGYLTGNVPLILFQPGWKAMSPITAGCIAALALPLLGEGPVRGPVRRAGALVLALGVCAIALAMLASHLVFDGDVLSTSVLRLLDTDPRVAGRMSMTTSLCLLMLGGASLARHWHVLAPLELCANTGLLIASSALLGYAYDITTLYSYDVFNSMALPTAVALSCVAMSLVLAEPDSRLGMAARAPHARGRHGRQLLALTALPPLLGWVLLPEKGTVIDGSAVAVFVMCTSVPMFYLLLEYGRTSELLQRGQQAQAAALEEEVARITAQLASTHRQQVASLEQLERARRSEVIAQLTGSIAHDFNNLLMVIGGSAQLMKLQMPAGHALMRHVDKISGTVTATARLTAQLAAFSRTQRLEAQPVAVDDMVRTAIDDHRTTLPQARLSQDLRAPDAWILGDRAQLELAVGHLLRNAGEALQEHGVVHISTSIAPSGSREGSDTVMIRVQDNGCGMTPDIMANAAEPFFTTKPAGQHQGLGLAQVAAVVHQASGSLHLSGAPGGGTRVDLCLPRHALQARPPRTDHPEEALTLASTGNRRLLVIDDDPDVRGVIVELLRSMHYEVIEANDGETGLRKLEQMQPALAIIDYLMPGMNGSEVARKARQQFPALPILFMSGYADSQAIAAIPYAQLLRKPILPKELEKAVSGALAMT